MYKYEKKYAKAIKNNTQLIGDKVIRKALLNYYNPYAYLEEVRFPSFVADMMFVSPRRRAIAGVEIKSDRDELSRLKDQLKGYLQYFNEVILVTTYSHLGEALDILRTQEFSRVGLLIYRMEGGIKIFETFKESMPMEIKGLDTKWIGKSNQLKQWEYLLEEIWGE